MKKRNFPPESSVCVAHRHQGPELYRIGHGSEILRDAVEVWPQGTDLLITEHQHRYPQTVFRAPGRVAVDITPFHRAGRRGPAAKERSGQCLAKVAAVAVVQYQRGGSVHARIRSVTQTQCQEKGVVAASYQHRNGALVAGRLDQLAQMRRVLDVGAVEHQNNVATTDPGPVRRAR